MSPSAEELCTLVITEAFPEDSGLFKCMAINSFGTVSCSAILEVYNGMMFIYTPVYPSQYNIIKMNSQINALTVFISCFEHTTPCRPGGTAGAWGHSPTGNGLFETGKRDNVPRGESICSYFLLHEERRGLSPSAAWLHDPSPSWLAHGRWHHQCCRVSRWYTTQKHIL